MVEIRSRQKYQYDAANRFVQVKNDSDVTIASYTYGSSNERNHLFAESANWNSPEVQK